MRSAGALEVAYTKARRTPASVSNAVNAPWTTAVKVGCVCRANVPLSLPTNPNPNLNPLPAQLRRLHYLVVFMCSFNRESDHIRIQRQNSQTNQQVSPWQTSSLGSGFDSFLHYIILYYIVL